MLSSFSHLFYPRKQTQVAEPGLKCTQTAMWADVRVKRDVKMSRIWKMSKFKRMKAVTAAAGKRNETKRGLDNRWRAATGYLLFDLCQCELWD